MEGEAESHEDNKPEVLLCFSLYSSSLINENSVVLLE